LYELNKHHGSKFPRKDYPLAGYNNAFDDMYTLMYLMRERVIEEYKRRDLRVPELKADMIAAAPRETLGACEWCSHEFRPGELVFLSKAGGMHICGECAEEQARERESGEGE